MLFKNFYNNIIHSAGSVFKLSDYIGHYNYPKCLDKDFTNIAITKKYSKKNLKNIAYKIYNEYILFYKNCSFNNYFPSGKDVKITSEMIDAFNIEKNLLLCFDFISNRYILLKKIAYKIYEDYKDYDNNYFLEKNDNESKLINKLKKYPIPRGYKFTKEMKKEFKNYLKIYNFSNNIYEKYKKQRLHSINIYIKYKKIELEDCSFKNYLPDEYKITNEMIDAFYIEKHLIKDLNFSSDKYNLLQELAFKIYEQYKDFNNDYNFETSDNYKILSYKFNKYPVPRGYKFTKEMKEKFNNNIKFWVPQYNTYQIYFEKRFHCIETYIKIKLTKI